MGCLGLCLKNRVAQFAVRLCFSHVGLFAIVLAYIVVGASIFRDIESPGDALRFAVVRSAYDEVELERNRACRALVTFVRGVNKNTDDREAHYHMAAILRKYQRKLIEAVENTSVVRTAHQPGYQGIEPVPQNHWGWASAILFCATILTTIGYGHVYPVTQMGYLVFLIYSIFAIPLMSIYLMNISKLLANGIRFVYNRSLGIVRKRRTQRKVAASIGEVE